MSKGREVRPEDMKAYEEWQASQGHKSGMPTLAEMMKKAHEQSKAKQKK